MIAQHAGVLRARAQTATRTRCGHLVVFSSVAGDRGRKPVAIYGSAKAGLSVYLEAMDHKYHSAGLSVPCVKPGFVKTAMTAGLKRRPLRASLSKLRVTCSEQWTSGTVIYTPGMWRLVMMVIRALPRFVMRKIGF